MKPIYWKSIAIGLAGILIIVDLFLFSAYMADQDMKEFNRIHRNYDNFMAGVGWWIFFFVATLVALALIGAVSAWVSSRDITSIRGTIIASALAGSVPIALTTIVLAFLFTIAFVNSMEYTGMSYLRSLFLLFMLYLFYGFVGIMLSVIGGLLYTLLEKALFKGKAPGSG